jgi:hypothetical protein
MIKFAAERRLGYLEILYGGLEREQQQTESRGIEHGRHTDHTHTLR